MTTAIGLGLAPPARRMADPLALSDEEPLEREDVALAEAARRVSAGDEQAFRVIVEATQAALHRLAVRLTGSTDDASDVLQVAYLSAFQALARGDFDGRSRVETWLYRIVVNAALNRRRSERRFERREIREFDEGSAVNRSPEAALLLRRVLAWIDELPDAQRVCLILKEVEERSAVDIAAILGCTVGAVEQKLFRARATLRERLRRDRA